MKNKITAPVFTFECGQIYTLADIPESHRELFQGCHHQGQCDKDVEMAAPSFAVDNADRLRDWLSEFGAWDQAELADDAENVRRMLWLLAGEITDQGEAYIGI